MFEPQWEGEHEGYATNYMAKHHWRIRSTVPWQDAMQEAAYVFMRCKRRYAATVTEPAHFMALFKTSLANRVNDLANENTERRAHTSLDHGDGGINPEHGDTDATGDTDNDGALAVAIRQAPREVQMVLSLLLGAPQELLDVALSGWRGNRDRRMRSGGSKRINQMLGLPEDRDTLQEVMDYFAP